MEMYYLSHRQARWVGDLELIESYVQLSVAGLFPHILLPFHLFIFHLTQLSVRVLCYHGRVLIQIER